MIKGAKLFMILIHDCIYRGTTDEKGRYFPSMCRNPFANQEFKTGICPFKHIQRIEACKLSHKKEGEVEKE